MGKLLILSIISQWVLIAVIVGAISRSTYRNRLEFSWRTTFFGKVRHGLDIYLWERPRNSLGGNCGRSIFGFSWRDPKTITDYPYIERDKSLSKYAMPRALMR